MSQVLAVDLKIAMFLWFQALTEICHAGFFSQRITAVLKVLSKSPSMKNAYKASLFSVRELKVSSDKTESFSSIVDKTPSVTE